MSIVIILLAQYKYLLNQQLFFDSYAETLTFASAAPMTAFTRRVAFTSDSSSSIAFKNSGGDSLGALLSMGCEHGYLQPIWFIAAK